MSDLIHAFGFFTIFPLSRRGGAISQIAASCYLLPLVALAVGAAAGVAAWGAMEIWGDTVAAAVTLALMLLLTGLHHADGLADFGDALMARGDRERRIDVLKDRTLGVGAVGALILTYLITWAALLELNVRVSGAGIIWYIIAAEVTARMALLLTAMASTPSHKGSGSAFITAAKGWRGLAGIIGSLTVLTAVGLATLVSVPLMAIGSCVLVASVMALTGKRWFGGVGGDLLGATVELARMAALLGMTAALNGWPGS